MIEILKATDAAGNLVFWLAFLGVLTKQPTVFNSLPRYLWWPMFLGLGVSGGAGILLWFFK
ncbi:hypothetical protein GNU46_22345 [Salmonella enterica]|uniref:Uncharacterized protein n=2 Tax=Jerseyvirus TaxID=1910991 RepID=A0A5B9N9M4_9CAUD|nr:hypothetical protein QA044_gp67 [Salmonella phage Shelanagig]YP_010747380.1 hypothetical protein QA045_gp33 [Salmonella phage NBSal006]EAV8298413.1 hypothetical protein [Salmonella enterica]EEK7123131.1 hypothetical protein [Salmonella enterica subsp. enterica serovar Enteritidis]EGU4045553.1 hypothetical protein [Salmonella enterica subsp. enterica]EBG1510394.1 hypothetical protein [Salmonella enterica]EBG7725893.1 hypothetical protein [Salmonella enterica]